MLERYDPTKPHPHRDQMKPYRAPDRRNMPRPAPRCEEELPPDTGEPQSDFARALQTACDNGEVLRLNSNITLDAPAHIRLNRSHQGWFGLDGGMHAIKSNVRGAPALRFFMDDATPQGVCTRGMFVGNFAMHGTGQEEGGLVLEVPYNDRWLVNLEMRSLWFEGLGGKAACTVAGSIFESFGYNVGTQDNKGAGLYFANAGPSGNKGIVSAFRLFGGTQRQNGGPGVMMDQYDGPGDVRIFGNYFCMNGDTGIYSICGLELIADCGFENNNGEGIYVENYCNLRDCTASTYGPQRLLVRGYVVNDHVLRSCKQTDYGGSGAQLAQFGGNGRVVLADSDPSMVEADDGVRVEVVATDTASTASRGGGGGRGRR